MRKRTVAFILALITVAAMLPAPGAAAAKTTSYDAEAALSYAKAHWNDGKGLCAEFVSRCVMAGGVDMKVQTTTGKCMKAIRDSTYLPELELKLDKNGYATKELNEGILSPGDPVVQYCETHKVRPHILICGGFDSKGRATFYAHNGAINNKVYKLNVNTAYEHTKNCDMRAHVIHLADLDTRNSGGGSENIGGIGTSSNVSEVKFSLPDNGDPWGARGENREHGGTTVGYVEKPAGVSVTRIGIRVMDYYWNPIVEYSFPVTKVKDSDTKFYFWFDTEKDLGMWMNTGSIYRYYWFGIFDGEEIEAYPNSYFYTKGESPTYTVTFDPSGGELTGPATAQIKGGEKFNTIWPSDPTREGYLFWGWRFDPSAETTVAPGDWVQGSITLYASWMRDPSVPEGFNVLLYDPDTDEFYDSIKVTNGEKYGDLPTPSKPGAVFLGWYTDTDWQTKVTADSTVSLEEDQTLYARWDTDPEITVTLEDFSTGAVYDVRTVRYGETYGDLTAPERDGYYFDGWYNGVGDEITPDTVVTSTEDQTIYCMWADWEPQSNESEYAFMMMPAELGMNERFTFYVRPHAGYEVAELIFEDRENGTRLNVHYDDYGNGVYRTTRTTNSFWIRASYRKLWKDFGDVPKDMYCYEPVAWAIREGVTTGKTEELFAPNDTCTQAQILTFLYRAAGEPGVTISNPYFNYEVDESMYYYNAMLWAYEQGLVSNKALVPSAPCTRGDVVTYLWKLAGSPSVGTQSRFGDVPSGAAYAQAVAWAVQSGITNGETDTTFAPSKTCTRGQIVTFLYRSFVEALR